MIKFSNICVAFNGYEILKNLSGSFEKGKISVILGANGAGKSTLLAALAGIIDKDSGSSEFDGSDFAQIPPAERAKLIGFLPQGGDIHWDVKVGALVEIGRLPHNNGWHLSDGDKAAIAEAMQICDINQFKDRIANKLSGGEKARVLLARVLAGQPEWIFADEPLAALDPLHQIETLAVFRKIADEGKGVVLVLHDLTHAARIADYITILDKGQVIAQGTPQAVLTPQTLARAYGISAFFTQCDDGKPIIITKGKAGM